MSVRLLGCFVAGMLLSACRAASDITAYAQLVAADTIAVTLGTTGVPLSGLPRLQIVGQSGEVSVVWEVESPPCLIASATAARAGSVIEIRLQRGFNPLADCAAGNFGYRYSARVPALAPGQYEVRLVDVFAQQLPAEVGRSAVVVN
jgi:hypothetical protein